MDFAAVRGDIARADRYGEIEMRYGPDMKRIAMCLAMLIGCGSEDPNEIVNCDDPMAWGKVGDAFATKCARACAGGPSGEADDDGDGYSDACPNTESGGCPVEVTARFDGDAYCCAPSFPESGEAAWTVNEGGCP